MTTLCIHQQSGVSIVRQWECPECILAERDQLRAEVERLKKYAAPVDATASVPRLKPCAHNEYWTTHYGHCMACRAEDAELQLGIAKKHLLGLMCDCGKGVEVPPEGHAADCNGVHWADLTKE